MNKEQVSVVTEVGVFGSMGLEDLTKKDLSPEEMEKLLEQARKENLANLTGKTEL